MANHDLKKCDLCEIIKGDYKMAKSSIVEKNTITIKGILSVSEDSNTIAVELEDGQAIELATTLSHFDGVDVTISVSNTVER